MSRLLANYSSSDDDESDHETPAIPAKRPVSPALAPETFVPADPSASSWLGTAKKQKRDFGPVTFVVGDTTKDDDANAPPSPPRPVMGGAKRGGGAGLFAFLPAPKHTIAAGVGSSVTSAAGDKGLAPPSVAKASSLAPPSAAKAGAGKRTVVKVESGSAGAAPRAESPAPRPSDDTNMDAVEAGPAPGPAPAPAPAPVKAAPAPVAKKVVKSSSSLFSFGGASSPLPSLPEPSASSAPPAPALSSYSSETPSWPLDPAAPHPSSAYAVAHPSEAYAYGASSSSSSSAVHPPAPTDDDVTQQLGIDRNDLRKLGISDKQLRQSSIAVRSVNVRESLAAEDLEQVSQAHLAAAPKPINQAMSANTKLSIMALAKKAVSQQGDMEQMFSANRVKKRIASKKYGF